jgi:hypothetical protein
MTLEVSFKQAIHTLGTYLYHFWMKPIKRGSGNQNIAGKPEKYKQAVKRKIDAYHRYVQLGPLPRASHVAWGDPCFPRDAFLARKLTHAHRADHPSCPLTVHTPAVSAAPPAGLLVPLPESTPPPGVAGVFSGLVGLSSGVGGLFSGEFGVSSEGTALFSGGIARFWSTVTHWCCPCIACPDTHPVRSARPLCP